MVLQDPLRIYEALKAILYNLMGSQEAVWISQGLLGLRAQKSYFIFKL